MIDRMRDALTRRFPGFTATLEITRYEYVRSPASIWLKIETPGSADLRVRFSLGPSDEPSPELLELCFYELMGKWGVANVLPAFYPSALEVMNHSHSERLLQRTLALRALKLGIFGSDRTPYDS
jgi:hypothetical protein